jgi:O-antigen/teichoic acid export membrane protein
LNFIKKITKTDLFKISGLNSLSVVMKLAIGLITSKILAIFVGPSGMALVGNFRNFVESCQTLSTMGFQNGIVKYVAESKEREVELKKYVATVFFSVLTVSVFISLLLFFFATNCNEYVFGNRLQYRFVFKAFAFALPWYALSLVLISIINGLGKYKSVIYINILGNFLGLLVSVYMVISYQITGALLAIIITPSLLFLVSFYYIDKELSLWPALKWSFFDFKIIGKLSEYFLMALVSGVVGSVVFLAIRKYIIAIVGIQQAGYWEAISRISTYYLLFVSSVLTLYFLPKLSVANTNFETKKVFWSYYKTLFPVFIFGLGVIYFLRFLIVKILFTAEFEPVVALFFWQLLGDAFKMGSWILGYQFFAKKMTLTFIVTELFSLTIMYFFCHYFVNQYGIAGAVMAHAATYAIYWFVLVLFFRKSLF